MRQPTVLKITSNEGKTSTTLRLEGRLAGVWVNECLQAWKALIPTIQEKQFLVDIRDLTFVDRNGAELLAEICSQHDTQFLTGGPLTEYFANQAIGASAKSGNILPRNMG